MPKTSTAVAKPSGKGIAVTTWKDKLKKYAQDAVAVADEAGQGGQFISVKAGQLTYNGAPCAGNQLEVVVVESVLENCFYSGDYDQDNPSPPACFAFGRESGELHPHEKSSDPQHKSCRGCPQNEFGTADKGKGKACKNIMRLALLPAKPLTADALSKSEIVYMKLPVTSVKSFTAYVKRLALVHELPPFAFVTKLSTMPDAKTQFKVGFEDVALISDDEVLEVLSRRHDEQREAIMFPYQPPSDEALAKKPAKAVAKSRKY